MVASTSAPTSTHRSLPAAWPATCRCTPQEHCLDVPAEGVRASCCTSCVRGGNVHALHALNVFLRISYAALYRLCKMWAQHC